MALAGLFVAMVVAFLLIDAIALKFMMYPLFERHVGPILREDVQMGVAAGFYIFFVAGIAYFAVLPALYHLRLIRSGWLFLATSGSRPGP